MTAPDLLALLRADGFTLRVEKGKLLCSPFSSLMGERREQVKAYKAALIDLLGLEAALDAVRPSDPFDEADTCPVVMDTCDVLRLTDVDGTQEFLAVPCGWWDELLEFAAMRKADAIRAQEKATQREKKRRQ